MTDAERRPSGTERATRVPVVATQPELRACREPGTGVEARIVRTAVLTLLLLAGALASDLSLVVPVDDEDARLQVAGDEPGALLTVEAGSQGPQLVDERRASPRPGGGKAAGLPGLAAAYVLAPGRLAGALGRPGLDLRRAWLRLVGPTPPRAPPFTDS